MFVRAKKEEVFSVETLMDSPLSRLIHVAASNCGYSGTTYYIWIGRPVWTLTKINLP